jgi:hypothetical protein
MQCALRIDSSRKLLSPSIGRIENHGIHNADGRGQDGISMGTNPVEGASNRGIIGK